jgi:hypothetical protein
MRLALALLCLLMLVGCNDDLEGDVLLVAVGAQATLELEPVQGELMPNRCDQPAGKGCLAFHAVSIEEVEVDEDDGIFELVSFDLSGSSILVEVRANRAGDAQLEVTFENELGDEVDQKFILRAAPIEAVVVEPSSCQSPRAEPPFLVTPGAAIAFETTVGGVHGARLATGNLDLVADFGGFELEEGDARSGVAVAPSEPGTYSWTPAGAASQPLMFTVYDPEEVAVALHDADEGIGVQLRREVDGRDVCAHDTHVLAQVEVSPSTCRPLVGDFEIAGLLPVTLSGRDPVVELVGDAGEACSVTAIVGGETVDETMVTPHHQEGSVPVGTGDPISSVGEPFGGKLVWRDDCQAVPEPDAFIPWSWEVFLHDAGEDDDNPSFSYVGTGLSAELWTTERYEHESGPQLVPPIDVTYSFAPAAGMVWEESGCVDGEYRVLALRPEAPADYVLEMDKLDGPSQDQFTVRVLDIASASYELDAPVSTAEWFVGTESQLRVRYYAADDTPLHGVAPVYIRSDLTTSGATYEDGMLYTGSVPNTLELSSFVAPDVAVVTVVDEAGISSIDGLDPATVERGESSCIAVSAQGTSGQPIYGTSPERPRLSLPSDGLYVDLTSAEGEGVCIGGGSTGEHPVEVTWGAATASETWTVR